MGRGLNKNIPSSSMIDGWMKKEMKIDGLSPTKRRGVAIILLNAIAGDGEYVTYLRRTAKVEDKRYNRWRISNTTFKWCVDALAEQGWIESVVGVSSPKEEDQCPSLFKATDKLLSLFPESEVVFVKKLYRESLETIVLRDAEKCDVGYRDNMERKQMRSVVKKLNLVNEKHIFKHNGELLNNSSMVRVFNETFTQGGRFYRADAHLIKQRDNEGLSMPAHMKRVGMTIDDCPVVEVDFGCLHPMIVCAKYNLLEERYLAKDFYSTFLNEATCVGADRQLFKNAVNIMFNATSKRSAEKAIQEEITKAKIRNNNTYVYSWHTGSSVIDRVFEVMPDMTDFFCTENSFGRTLQHVDSCIAERIIERFVAAEKPIVPVHDSFLVKHTDEVFLCNAMEAAFRHVTGNADILITLKVSRHTGEEKVVLC